MIFVFWINFFFPISLHWTLFGSVFSLLLNNSECKLCHYIWIEWTLKWILVSFKNIKRTMQPKKNQIVKHRISFHFVLIFISIFCSSEFCCSSWWWLPYYVQLNMQMTKYPQEIYNFLQVQLFRFEVKEKPPMQITQLFFTVPVFLLHSLYISIGFLQTGFTWGKMLTFSTLFHSLSFYYTLYTIHSYFLFFSFIFVHFPFTLCESAFILLLHDDHSPYYTY